MTVEITKRELFAMHFALRLLAVKPGKVDKGKVQIACDFGTAVSMADALSEALDNIPSKPLIKDPDDEKTDSQR